MILGYPECEVWDMTLAKIVAMYEEHKKELGIKINPTIDDIIP